MASDGRECLLQTSGKVAAEEEKKLLEEGKGTIDADSLQTAGVPSGQDKKEESQSSTESSEDREESQNNVEATDDAPACFPSAATVQTLGDKTVRIADVQIGDRVLVSGGQYSAIFAFTHRDPKALASYTRLKTASGESVCLTPGHFLRVNGELSPARSVEPGDELETANGTLTKVVSVGCCSGSGLYNPQTLDGEIVVDGILASTYTTAIEPSAAHAWLAPARLAFRLFGLRTKVLEQGQTRVRRLGSRLISTLSASSQFRIST